MLAAKGAINLSDAQRHQHRMKWEKHGALAQRWLTTQYAELKPADRLTFSREIARAVPERDKAIAALQLGAKVERPWLALPAPNGDGEEPR